MKKIILNIPETQEDCDNMEDCKECRYYNEFNSYGCENFLEGL